MAKTTRTNNVLLEEDKIIINERLHAELEVITPRTPRQPRTGLVKYINQDVDDATLAVEFSKEFGINITAANIAGVRARNHGLLQSGPRERGDSALTAEVAAMQKTLLELIERTDKLEKQPVPTVDGSVTPSLSVKSILNRMQKEIEANAHAMGELQAKMNNLDSRMGEITKAFKDEPSPHRVRANLREHFRGK